jgi:hypothetical protein
MAAEKKKDCTCLMYMAQKQANKERICEEERSCSRRRRRRGRSERGKN